MSHNRALLNCSRDALFRKKDGAAAKRRQENFTLNYSVEVIGFDIPGIIKIALIFSEFNFCVCAIFWGQREEKKEKNNFLNQTMSYSYMHSS